MSETFVLKFGGNAIRGKDDLMRLSGEIAKLIKGGKKIILIHGGGPEISAEMEKRGMIPKMVGGVRITDEAVLEVAEKVLRDINAEVVSCLEASSVRAVGAAGYIFSVCRKKPAYTVKENGKDVTVDLGLVGEIAEVNIESLTDLLDAGITPVIYPISKSADGVKYNINGDTMAAGIAVGVKCAELIAITDVPGILMNVSDPSSKIDRLDLKRVDELIASGVISGGMIPKVEACRDALNAGVKAVRMVNGKDKKSIVADILDGAPHGTVITK